MYTLLHMTLAGAVLIAAIMLLRLTGSRLLKPRLFIVLWDIVIARLLVPVFIPAPFGLDSILTTDTSDIASMQASVHTSQSIWVWIWIAGAAATAVWFTALYRREWDLVRDALPIGRGGSERLAGSGVQTGRTRILVSDRITTPIAGGVIRPRIILPASWEEWDQDTVRFALTHELSHIACFDIVQKLIASAAICVNWFNPLVWIMRGALDRDLEKACDEKVVMSLGEQVRCEYADTLVTLAAQRSGWSAFGSEFGRSAIHERIVSMMQARKSTVAGMLCAALALAGSSATFASAASPSEQVLAAAPDAVYVFDNDTGRLYQGGRLVGVLSAESDELGATEILATFNGDLPDNMIVTLSPLSGDGVVYIWNDGSAG